MHHEAQVFDVPGHESDLPEPLDPTHPPEENALFAADFPMWALYWRSRRTPRARAYCRPHRLPSPIGEPQAGNQGGFATAAAA
jgi:hypothetical protein